MAQGTVTSLDVDSDARFLLSGGADAQVRVFDLASGYKAKQIAVSPADKKVGHKFSVTSVCWYPHDTGLFTSTSTDKTVKVWDANTMQPACSFFLKEKVQLGVISDVCCASALIAGAC
ncbi:UNVERIFIED_CONTAM: DNA excision repair protein ERCC-8 [Siphonaria sp. JEL0065]|nr:DNA excision repair protein ERCC-8 [Siphonaria sp. JEL0065]